MQYFVNVTFANIYRKPTFHCEVDTQAVLWEELQVEEKIESFYRVQTEDHYEGWINEHQVAVCHRPQEERRMVTALAQKVYNAPNASAEVMRTVGAGSTLPIVQEKNGWYEVLLPDEKRGFVPNEAFAPPPGFSRDGLLQIARRFLGVTYVWGGKTPFGLDCSGFVQLSLKLLGKNVRRDAWMQFEDSHPVSKSPKDARAGDLYFFSENGDKITHVAITMGGQKFIHARGMVRINSLKEDDPEFTPDLLHDFVEVRTFF
ncbi:C40 family peptidase [Caldithrix abyssi]